MAISNKEILDLFDRYESVDKGIIHKNVDLLFDTHYKYKNQTGSKRIAIIASITQSAYNTVLAWNNSSRPTKIPLIKLVQLADAFDISVDCFFDEDSTWLNDDLSERLDKRIIELEGEYSND